MLREGRSEYQNFFKMKRFITPLLFFGAVLSVSAFFLKYSFCQMEALGYFAFSPDYLREVFCSSLPLSHLLSDFLTQVFRYVVAGPLTMAVVMLIFFLMLRSILRRFGFGSDIVPIVISLTLWWFSSKAESFLLPSAALLMVFVVFLVSRFFHRLSSDSIWKWDVPVSATLVIAVSVAVILTPKVKDNERWAEVEYFAYR